MIVNEEINKIINWIEMSYTRLNYKEELLLVNYIKQLQQENARLKEKNQKAFKIVDEKLTNLNLTYGVNNEFREEYDELWEILKDY